MRTLAKAKIALIRVSTNQLMPYPCEWRHSQKRKKIFLCCRLFFCDPWTKIQVPDTCLYESIESFFPGVELLAKARNTYYALIRVSTNQLVPYPCEWRHSQKRKKIFLCCRLLRDAWTYQN
ncbi:hypothetical protein [Algoriphagus machipongonensis]|uniref:hypothetical protein n=1 Tax=Algoriphagus machipongonensis TaxID=388413 RepID=UPI0012932A1E|nr:hypothetical protein [Algoriphagus machipongonensis]